MTNPIARDPIYSKRAFDVQIIEHCVRHNITYRLLYRDLVEMMAERGVHVAHCLGRLPPDCDPATTHSPRIQT